MTPTTGALSGQTAIVTGATSGIGAAIARELTAAGAHVMLTGRNTTRGQALARELPNARFTAADLADPAAPGAIIAATLAAFGKIDVLINNAGIIARGTAAQTNDALWAQLLDVNLSSAFRMSRAVLPAMQTAGGGAIVNVASDWALVGARGALAYAVAKAGLAQLTRCMALDHAREHIRVNAVCPGDTDTPMLAHEIASAAGEDERGTTLADFGAALPIGRVAQPAEIARAVLFLASPAASFITGALLPVDGGNTAQ